MEAFRVGGKSNFTLFYRSSPFLFPLMKIQDAIVTFFSFELLVSFCMVDHSLLAHFKLVELFSFNLVHASLADCKFSYIWNCLVACKLQFI